MRSPCDGTDGSTTLPNEKYIADKLIDYSDVAAGSENFDYDLSTYINVLSRYGACTIDDHFEFNVIGYRWTDQLISDSSASQI